MMVTRISWQWSWRSSLRSDSVAFIASSWVRGAMMHQQPTMQQAMLLRLYS